MRLFFDTNILVYAHDPDEEAKRSIARAVLEQAIAEKSMVLSTQVLVEFYSTAIRQKLMRPVHALELVRVWSEHDTVSQTPELVLRGIALQQEHSLSTWDGWIVQAALDARCDILLSEDLQHGRRFGELEIRNPFIAAGAHEPRNVRYGVEPKRIRRKAAGKKIA